MKKKTVVVKLEWIEDAVSISPNGSCNFHYPEFCEGCGPCQLAMAYIKANRKKRKARS